MPSGSSPQYIYFNWFLQFLSVPMQWLGDIQPLDLITKFTKTITKKPTADLLKLQFVYSAEIIIIIYWHIQLFILLYCHIFAICRLSVTHIFLWFNNWHMGIALNAISGNVQRGHHIHSYQWIAKITVNSLLAVK